jgi:threonine/homoserine efflux transporter RhtA
VEAVARVEWIGSRPFRSAGRRKAGPCATELSRRLGGPLSVVGSSASLQTAAALATTVFAVYGPAGTGAMRFAVAAAVLLALAITVAAVLTLPVGMPAALDTQAPSDLAIVSAVAVLGIAVPYALEYAAIRSVSVKAFSVFLSLDPAIAALAGLLWLNQHLAAAELLGLGLVVAASTGVMSTRSPR